MILVLAFVTVVSVGIDGSNSQTDFSRTNYKYDERREDAIADFMPFFDRERWSRNVGDSLEILNHMTKLLDLTENDRTNRKRVSMPGPTTYNPFEPKGPPPPLNVRPSSNVHSDNSYSGAPSWNRDVTENQQILNHMTNVLHLRDKNENKNENNKKRVSMPGPTTNSPSRLNAFEPQGPPSPQNGSPSSYVSGENFYGGAPSWNRDVEENQLTKLSHIKGKDKQNEKRLSMKGPTITVQRPDIDILQPEMPGMYPFEPQQPLEYEFLPPDMSVEDFLSKINIESSGWWATGGVTLTVSFPAVTTVFNWIVATDLTSKRTYYTKGQFRVSMSTLTTSLFLDEMGNLNTFLNLFITLQKYTVFIKFNQTSLLTPGIMKFTRPDTILEAPDQVFVNEDGNASFTIRAPPMIGPSIKPGLDAFYIFLNTSSDTPSVGTDILYSRFSVPPPPPNITEDVLENITIDVGPNAQRYGGTISISSSLVLVSPQGAPFVSYVNVGKSVNVVPYNRSLVDGVAFGSYYLPLETKEFQAFIKHGSIQCSAVGNPPPNLRIKYCGTVVNSYSMGEDGVSRRIFHPLDGKLISDVRGAYICEAESAGMTITRDIFVTLQRQ